MIRAARPEDADAIVAIWNAVIRESAITFTPDEKSVAEVVGMIADRPGFLVAEDGTGAVSGFVAWSQFRAGPGYSETMEHTVHLAPGARGQGTGRALLAEAERVAADAGVRVMVAGVSSANPDGRAFHLACGYVESGVLHGVGTKFGHRYDLHLLTRTVS